MARGRASAQSTQSLSPRALSPWLLGLYCASVVGVPVALVTAVGDPTALSEPAPEPAAQADALVGIWWRYEPGGVGERLRFYYFHGDGTGLYRYGRVGLTNTHSFDYRVEGDLLHLRFRKTGEEHVVRFVLEHDADKGRDWLVLGDDPREPGSTRYHRDAPRPIEPGEGAQHGSPPSGRMWIDITRYATGGYAFAMYQLRPAGIDGRGTGWFHRGDYDDWSTESLVYRIVGDRLDLEFSLAGERASTAFALEGDEADGEARKLLLVDDPRDYWRPHTYLDGGPSFGALAPMLTDPDR